MMSCTNSEMRSGLSDGVTKTYKRKVAAIKKSVYVNIPSKIAKECSISKGSLLEVTLEGGRVIFYRHSEEILPEGVEPTLAPETKPNEEEKDQANALLYRFEDW